MLTRLAELISQSLEFSKAEARGTLAIGFIALASIVISHIYAGYLKNEQIELSSQEEAIFNKWVEEIKNATVKKDHIRNTSKKVTQTSTIASKKETRVVEQSTKARSKKVVEVIPEISDLNKASKEELEKVHGIGPIFSQRIVRYRKLLGGFSSADQLEEVYGLKKEIIEEIKKHFRTLSSPSKIKINSDSVNTLYRHPYLTKDQAWIIFNYRKQNGDIKTINQLEEIKSLNKEQIEKLKPYIQF